MRNLTIGGLILASSLVSAPANACRDPLNERGIFFKQWPAPISSPVAAKITILEVSHQYGKHPTGLARIDELLTGDLPEKVIRLVLPLEMSCGPFVRVGQSGIALGTLLGDGSLEIIYANRREMHPEKSQSDSSKR